MNRDLDKLEHLFSREIDGEATPAERHQLETLLRDEPRLQAMFDEYRLLDDVTGAALRNAMQPATIPISRRQGWWQYAGRTGLLAVAACIATLIWLRPPAPTPLSTGRDSAPTQAGIISATGEMPSWFVQPEPARDVVAPVPTVYERPQVQMRGTERNWILIPGDEPGVFMVIEVDQVRTHRITVQQDF